MTNALDVSKGLAQAVAGVGERIARVEGRRRQSASGILWDTNTVVTAGHVVPPQRELFIGLPNGERVPAKLVGVDPTTDVAVLEIEGAPANTPPTAALPSVGELALAVARPGPAVRADMGIVTVSEGAWRTGAGAEVASYLEAGLTMYPGFSGGALAGVDGVIWGMLSSALVPGHAVAIPTATLSAVIADLREHGYVRRGYLGVGVQRAALPEAAAETIGRNRGLLVASVEPDSPAAAAGILVGDLLVGLDGTPLVRPDDLLAALTGQRVGKPVSAELVRGGQAVTLSVTLEERAETTDESTGREGRSHGSWRGRWQSR